MTKLALIVATVALWIGVAQSSPVYLYCWSEMVQDYVYQGKYATRAEAEATIGDRDCRIQEELE